MYGYQKTLNLWQHFLAPLQALLTACGRGCAFAAGGLLLLSLALTPIAHANDRVWDGDFRGLLDGSSYRPPCPGVFGSISCWGTDDYPTYEDHAIYANNVSSGNRTVDFEGYGNLESANASVIGSGYTWLNGGYNIYGTLTIAPAPESSASLTIRNDGAVPIGRIYAGSTVLNSTGTLWVDEFMVFETNSLAASDLHTNIETWGGVGSTSYTGGRIRIKGPLALSDGAYASSKRGEVDDMSAPYAVDSIDAYSATITGAQSRWTTDDFYVGNDGTGTVTVSDYGWLLSSNAYLGNKYGSVGILNLGTNGFLSSSYLYIGNESGSEGTLNIARGGVTTHNSGYLGYRGTGTATLSGNGAEWALGGGLYLGGHHSGSTGGSGTLNVTSGGKVTAGTLKVWGGDSLITTGATGGGGGGKITVEQALVITGRATSYIGLVDEWIQSSDLDFDNSIEARSAAIGGADARWDTGYFYLGIYGDGTTTVSNGGTLTSSYGTFVGGKCANCAYGGIGILNVSGGGLVRTSDAYIGLDDAAEGNLNVTSGGRVENTADGYLGYRTGSTGLATVAGEDSTWTNNGAFHVGLSGSGTLEISSGGEVTNTTGSLGTDAGASGTASVSGGSTWINNGALHVGQSGTGTLSIFRGGTVSSTAGYLGTNPGANGMVSVGCALIQGCVDLWDVSGGMNVGGNAVASGGAGTLNVFSGGTVNAGSLTVWNGGSSIYTGGTASGSGGQINIDGALTLSGTATSFRGSVDSVSTDVNNSIEALSATITGAGSRWDTSTFFLGYQGAGSATVANGGVLASTADILIGGLNGSAGSLTVMAGGMVDTNASAFLGGFTAAATGSATVGGTGALWDVNSGLYLGGTANSDTGAGGTLTVNSGGTVNAGNLTVWNGNSSITTGSPHTSNGGRISIAGTLTLTGGGKATSDRGVVDSSAVPPWSNRIDAHSATITGTGSRWDTANFYSGYYGEGTTTVSAGGVLAATGATFAGVESGSAGTLNITAGGTVDTGGSGYLGYFSGSSGAVTVGGSDALWDVGSDLFVGGTASASGGAGSLMVNSGGTVNASNLTVWNSNSAVTTGSTADQVGGQINVGAAFTLTGGGKATSFWGLVDNIGTGWSNSIEASTATITGAGSRWDTRDFYAGRTGAGTTTVADGGVLATANAHIGVSDGSAGNLIVTAGGTADTNGAGFLGYLAGSRGSATVDGTDALWDVSAGLYVGGNAGAGGGSGSLSVQNGGAVAVGSKLKVWNSGSVKLLGGSITAGGFDAAAGTFTFTDGTLTVNGGAYSDGNADLVVGSTGPGANPTLVLNGASAEVAGDAFIGQSGSGTLKIDDGGTLDVVGEMSVFRNGTVNVAAGQLSVLGGLVNEGTLTGAGSIVADIHNSNGGSVGPGNSPGLLSIEGDYTQDAFSLLSFELAGTDQGVSYDWLDVTGTAYLGGELELLWYGGFEASLDDSFDLFTAESFSGEFDLLTLALLGDGLGWDVSFITDEIGSLDVLRLSVVSGVSQVPLPAGFWLFSSGLLGLIGISRRKKAA